MNTNQILVKQKKAGLVQAIWAEWSQKTEKHVYLLYVTHVSICIVFSPY